MKTVFDGYTKIETESKQVYFAGCNTETGFRGVYDDVACEDSRDRVYIIKGGSGTGKSTLMRKIAEDAEKMGVNCTYYLCGSDPASLDAVVLGERIVVLDGTPPHARDMKYPGAVSTLIDVTQFWREGILAQKKEEIQKHTAEKQGAFSEGYRFLHAAAVLEKETFAVSDKMLDYEKMERFCRRMLQKHRKILRIKNGKGEVRYVYTHGIGMQGMVYTDTFFKQTQNHYGIDDAYGTAGGFLSCLAECCRDLGYDIVLARLPLNERLAAAVIPALSLSLTINSDYTVDKTIHMSRFLKKEPFDREKGKLRLTNKCMTSLLTDAANCFRAAGDAHFALEKIYGEAMDFRSLNAYTNRIRKEMAEKLWL